MMSHPARSFRKIWAIPCALALLTLAGLVSALLGTQLGWKIVAWLALALPLAVILWFAGIRPRS